MKHSPEDSFICRKRSGGPGQERRELKNRSVMKIEDGLKVA